MILAGAGVQSHNRTMLLCQAVLNTLGGLILLLLAPSPVANNYFWASLGCAASGALVFLWTSRRKPPCPDLHSSIVSALMQLPVCFIFWVSHAEHAALGTYWTPFRPHELAALSVAILAPMVPAIGVFSILLFAMLAAIQFQTDTNWEKQFFPPQPLAGVMAFAAFALVLYFFRLRSIRLASFAARKELESEMSRQLALTLMAIKDLANSPIQALILDAEILKKKLSGGEETIQRIQQNAQRLRELNELLERQLRLGTGGKVDPEGIIASLNAEEFLNAGFTQPK